MSQPYYYNPPGFEPQNNFNSGQNGQNFQLNIKMENEKKQLKKYGNIMGLLITFYFVLQTVISFPIIASKEIYNIYNTSAAFQYSFNIIGVSVCCVALPFLAMVLIYRKKGLFTDKIVPDKKIGFVSFLEWSCFGIGACVAINYFVTLLITVMNFFGFDLISYDSISPSSAFECVLLAVSTAVAPAVCEELAFRCCSLQFLRKNGKVFAVVASSIIFGFLHANVLQFIFATLVGLLLGYITVKTDSVLPAVFIHFANNFRSVIYDIGTFAGGEKVAETLSVIVVVLALALGVYGLVMLLKRGLLKIEKEQSDMSLGKKLRSFFFVPGMIIPFILMVYYTVTTIEKI